MTFNNKKKDGVSIIEVMVSLVIILVVVLLIGPNLFSTYEKSKEMSKVSDAKAIVNAVDMHNLHPFIEGNLEPLPENVTMSDFKKINQENKYLNNWHKWVDDSMTLKSIRDIANRVKTMGYVSRAIDNRV